MRTTYHINPRIKKHWFKQNSVVYDLIKYSEEETHLEYFPQKSLKTIFSSPNIDEVITIKNNLER